MKTEFKARLAVPAAMIGETARAVSFLSRLPVPSRFFGTADGPLCETVRAFPIAGLVVAMPATLLLAVLAGFGEPPLMTGLLVIALQIAVTGGLHEDGLADSADGEGAGGDRERILAAMKDSRIGSFGVIALMFSIGIRVAAVAMIAASLSPLAAALAFIGIAAASRGAMVWHWQALPPARPDGVAAQSGRPEENSVNWAIALGIGILVICLVPTCGALAAAGSLAAIAVATTAVTRHAEVRIGGHTGDTIGAAEQIAELAGFVALVLLL